MTWMTWGLPCPWLWALGMFKVQVYVSGVQGTGQGHMSSIVNNGG